MSKSPDVNRRGLFGAVAAGAAAAALPNPAAAQIAPAGKPAALPPSAAVGTAETEKPLAPREATLVGRTGSDFMVDVLKTLSLDYVATMPGSTFRGLHESLINYGGNRAPELLTCLHEEVAVGICHGYAKVAHKPMAALLHGVVGVQHGSMAIYNCWADRVPALVMIGNTAALEERRPGAEWAHSAQDNAAMIRDYVKWDDQPVSLPHFAQSTVRAYKQMITPPFAPVALVVDGGMAEASMGEEAIEIPRLGSRSMPVGDPAALIEAAKHLVSAQAPVLVLDRCVRSEQGLANVVALAEALGCAVIDKGARLNFPTRHPLNQTLRARAVLAEADVVMGIDVSDLFGVIHSYRDRIHRDSISLTRPGAKVISLSVAEMLIKSNYQDFQRLEPADLTILGDGEASVPLLLEAVLHLRPQASIYADRAAKLGAAAKQTVDRVREAATYGWDASPISVARLCAELYGQVMQEDWAMISPPGRFGQWTQLMWNATRTYQHIGETGGYGVGCATVMALGGALAHRDVPGGGRVPVAVLGDGDLMCAPSILWTAAHHRIPMLIAVHNNRAYHQEIMHVQRMAARHGRGIENAHIGTAIDDPNIDFAKLANSMGVWAEGPIEDPTKLGPAIARAVAMVKSGAPALLDVVCQPR